MQPKNFESRIQDLVYNVDVGIGVQLIKISLFILSILAVMSLYTASEFWGLKDAEAMDQAQVGYQLMQTGSFSTKYIRPAAVWMLTTNGMDARSIMLSQPDIVNPPVYPWVLSKAFSLVSDSFAPGAKFRTFPPEQWAMIPIGHACTLLTGLFLFLMARRFFERRIALTCVILFFVSEVVWSTSTSGLNISMATLFATLSVYFTLVTTELVNASAHIRKWLTFLLLAGVFCTLTLLTRYSAGVIIAAAALILVLLIPQRGWKLALSLLGIVLLLSSPWFIRNYQVSGHFFGLTPYLALNGLNPGYELSFERAVTPSLVAWRRTVQVQWMANARAFYDTFLPQSGNGIIMALFLTTYFFRFARVHLNALRMGMLLSMVLLFIAGGFFGKETFRGFYMFWPLVILYGTSFFYLLLDRMQLAVPALRTALIGLLMLITALPLILTMLPPRVGYPYPPYYPSYTTLVTRMLNQDELLCTDMPWATAWYGNVSSILLPASVEEFYEINDLQKRISGIYFTTLTRDLPYARTLATGPLSSWFPIFNERVPINFPLGEAFFLSGRDQLFLTDRPRWSQ